MGWDIYCAVCGGPFRNSNLLPPADHTYPEDSGLDIRDIHHMFHSPDIYGDYCDNTVLSEQSIAWLRDVRVIGKSNHKAFITGVGVDKRDGAVLVDPGDDENVPSLKCMSSHEPGKLLFETYETELRSLWHPSFPLHAKCFDMLVEVQKGRSRKKTCHIPEGLDIGILHRGMCKAAGHHFSDLNLDGYAEFAESMEEWWSGPAQTLEPWYHDPLDIPILMALDQTKQPRRVRVWARGSLSAANCLSDLIVEIFILIADHLDTQSVLQLTRTCREVNAILSKNFWRRRLFTDMPYLFELKRKVDEDAILNVKIDWQGLYARMMLQSYPGSWDRVWWKFIDPSRQLPPNADQMLEHLVGFCRGGLLKGGNMVSKFDPRLIGIASRRRVWKCAEELLDICEKQALEDGDSENSDTDSEDNEDEE